MNRMQDQGSNRDFGVTQDSKLYFDLSTPGRHFDSPQPTAPSFADPRRGGQTISQYKGEKAQPMGVRAENPPDKRPPKH